MQIRIPPDSLGAGGAERRKLERGKGNGQADDTFDGFAAGDRAGIHGGNGRFEFVLRNAGMSRRYCVGADRGVRASERLSKGCPTP
jgi:hypothetical protein